MSDEPDNKPVSGIVTKDKKANAGKYSFTYASLANVIEMIRVGMRCDFIQSTFPASRVGFEDMCKCVVATRITKPEEQATDEYIAPVPVLTGSGGGNPMQAFGGSMNYARRYSLQLAFGIATDDEDRQQKALQEETERQRKTDSPITEAQVQEVNRLFKQLGVTTIGQAGELYETIIGVNPHGSRNMNQIQAERMISQLRLRLTVDGPNPQPKEPAKPAEPQDKERS
ncbi:ERF family protein [Bifidobacterium tissieri]|uniref:Uncharacterized protein n=1 Tax=Bifidobacterium tissieri TaxID=1630162 RepID=A0A5M9ZVD8_9BIFI|nr:ERF family protein [Bifidobacterium tissieri]KAA8828654.1 hypothetical protein EM849_11495 [Bifidobacterium tissieri]KAA8831597.1 hypothetical protein EMO89_02410 [Bifidobacterium tissieri]